MVKIERSFLAPDSLESEAKKVSGSYEQPDVVSRLRKDFHNKCYICELKNLQDPQVEHLLPHKNGKYPERKFDWNNLFWSCSHCNGIKNQKKYDDGIIDCCKNDPVPHFTLMDCRTFTMAVLLIIPLRENAVKRITIIFIISRLENF